MERLYYVYILASRSRTLYTGITNNVIRRTGEHREGTVKGFTSKYRIHRFVHYEMFQDVRTAIVREKAIKNWTRAKKILLIQSANPTWEDKVEDRFPRFPRKADSSLRSE